eukprot:NODE_206_length_12919_cov_0.381357.p5 type:complete len:324 gc:universal NODE_206_length_12919_cov_0.381357:3302-2331(-)
MSNFLAHDMTPNDPNKLQKEENERRAKEIQNRPTKRATSLGHEQEEQKTDFKKIVNGGFQDYNLDGTPKKSALKELPVDEGNRRALKKDARITNGAHEHTPEQLEKLRIQNELRKKELQDFKEKHAEAKKRQEMLEKEQEKKLAQESGTNFGNGPEFKTNNGRKAVKDHVYERTEKFDIIAGEERDRIYDGYGKQSNYPSGRRQNTSNIEKPESKKGSVDFQNEMITDLEFKELGVRSKSVSHQNSTEMFNDYQAEDNSRLSSAQLPPLKNSSTIVSKPGTASSRISSGNMTMSPSEKPSRRASDHTNDDPGREEKVFFVHLA